MATTKLNIGKIPISKGEYQEGTTYQRLNQVTMLGSTYQSKIDDNTSAPAQMGADGAVENINTDKWLCVAVGNVSAARKVVYNNETSGLEAGNVQEAIDETNTKVSDLSDDVKSINKTIYGDEGNIKLVFGYGLESGTGNFIQSNDRNCTEKITKFPLTLVLKKGYKITNGYYYNDNNIIVGDAFTDTHLEAREGATYFRYNIGHSDNSDFVKGELPFCGVLDNTFQDIENIKESIGNVPTKYRDTICMNSTM